LKLKNEEHNGQKNHAYRFMHELDGKLALGIAIQEGNYICKTNNETILPPPWPNLVPQLFAYSKNYLKGVYIFWGAQEPYFSQDVVGYFQ
jgi:hypothetical protein